jgi:hypothetical protein
MAVTGTCVKAERASLNGDPEPNQVRGGAIATAQSCGSWRQTKPGFGRARWEN